MAALPDETTNVPLSNTSTKQHLDNLILESSQLDRNDLGSPKVKLNDALQPLFPDDRFWSIANIVGGLVTAVALAVGHHIFLHYLDAHNIEELPQVWIKGANNGFSNIFSIFVGLSAGSALTQVVRLFSCLYVSPVCLMIVLEMASVWQRTVANVHYR